MAKEKIHPEDDDSTWPVPYQTVKIRMSAMGKGRIWIDDVELASTLSVEFAAGGNVPNVITIKMVGKIDFESRFKPGTINMEKSTE